jgi:hypothetical protein
LCVLLVGHQLTCLLGEFPARLAAYCLSFHHTTHIPDNTDTEFPTALPAFIDIGRYGCYGGKHVYSRHLGIALPTTHFFLLQPTDP